MKGESKLVDGWSPVQFRTFPSSALFPDKTPAAGSPISQSIQPVQFADSSAKRSDRIMISSPYVNTSPAGSGPSAIPSRPGVPRDMSVFPDSMYIEPHQWHSHATRSCRRVPALAFYSIVLSAEFTTRPMAAVGTSRFIHYAYGGHYKLNVSRLSRHAKAYLTGFRALCSLKSALN